MTEKNGGGPFRVGLLVPSSNNTMEMDFHRELPDDLEIATARMFLPETTKEAEIEMIDRWLEPASRDLATVKPAVTVFGCTSGGSLFGQNYDEGIRRKIGEETGSEAISILSALSEEFALLGAKKLAVVTPYVQVLTDAVRDSLTEDGFEILAIGGMGITDNLEIGRQHAEAIAGFARETLGTALEEADCLFVSCTNLPAVRSLPELRAAFPGLPVMTSNLAVINAVKRRYEKFASSK
jgi:maleate isomerase